MNYSEILRLGRERGLNIKVIDYNTISKSEAQEEKKYLIAVDSIYPRFRNLWKHDNPPLPDGTPFRGTWAKRWGEINWILTNPEIIKRWESEELIQLENQRIAKQLAEKTRLELIAKEEQKTLELFTRLENQRIAKQQAEIKRLELVAQAQIQAEINANNLRIKLIKEEEELQRIEQLNKIQMDKDKETQRIEKAIPLLSSIIPLTAIGLLLLYSSKGKK